MELLLLLTHDHSLETPAGSWLRNALASYIASQSYVAFVVSQTKAGASWLSLVPFQPHSIVCSCCFCYVTVHVSDLRQLLLSPASSMAWHRAVTVLLELQFYFIKWNNICCLIHFTQHFVSAVMITVVHFFIVFKWLHTRFIYQNMFIFY